MFLLKVANAIKNKKTISVSDKIHSNLATSRFKQDRLQIFYINVCCCRSEG